MSGNEPQKHPLVTELEELLSVQRMGDGWYLGMRKPGGVGRVFGGQVIAQALAAAQDTVGSERIAHSLHAYFMRAGTKIMKSPSALNAILTAAVFRHGGSSRCKRTTDPEPCGIVPETGRRAAPSGADARCAAA
jgi:acyl-CoA thioesterase